MFFFDGEDLTVADENDIWLYIEECDVREYETIFDVDGAVFEFRQEAANWLLRPTGANDLPDLGRRAEKYAAASNLVVEDADFLLGLVNGMEKWSWEHRWPKRPNRWANRMRRDPPPPPYSRF
jgi:hypothetical protein